MMLLLLGLILGWFGLSLLAVCLCVAARLADAAREATRAPRWLAPTPVRMRSQSA
jgi:plasmid replication initiation protein